MVVLRVLLKIVLAGLVRIEAAAMEAAPVLLSR